MPKPVDFVEPVSQRLSAEKENVTEEFELEPYFSSIHLSYLICVWWGGPVGGGMKKQKCISI